jgi:hypothetical protein
MKPALILFLSGMLATGYLVIAAFFLRFWKQTRDRFFIYFSLAFGLFAVQRAMLVDEFALVESKTWAYVLRLIGFVLIVYAIVIKNREHRS